MNYEEEAAAAAAAAAAAERTLIHISLVNHKIQ